MTKRNSKIIQERKLLKILKNLRLKNMKEILIIALLLNMNFKVLIQILFWIKLKKNWSIK